MAEALITHNGMIYLGGVKAISLPLAQKLIRCQGFLLFSGVRGLSAEVRGVLRQSARIHVPD